jgi:multidrug resistance efflux pump
MNITSPKDGFVIKVVVKDKQVVKTGDLLLQMDSEQEDRNAARVETMESIRQLRSAQYTGPQLDLLRAIAKIAVDLASEKAGEMKLKFENATRGLALGLINKFDFDLVKSDYTQAQLEQSRAEAQQKQLEFSITRHNQADALAKQQSEDLKSYIARKKERLKVVASKDGHVKLLVAEGSFAELGSVLLEVN